MCKLLFSFEFPKACLKPTYVRICSISFTSLFHSLVFDFIQTLLSLFCLVITATLFYFFLFYSKSFFHKSFISRSIYSFICSLLSFSVYYNLFLSFLLLQLSLFFASNIFNVISFFQHVSAILFPIFPSDFLLKAQKFDLLQERERTCKRKKTKKTMKWILLLFWQRLSKKWCFVGVD
jgi:hypothetical protein